MALIDFGQTNGQVSPEDTKLLDLVPDEGDVDAEVAELEQEEGSAHYGEEFEKVLQNLGRAVRGADLKTLRCILGEAPEVDRTPLLRARLKGDTVPLLYPPGKSHRGRMPYVDRDVQIREPTLLILAVAKLNPETVSYLAGFEVGIEDTVSVEDSGNSHHVYNGVNALHLAAMAGKLKMVQSLLSCGAALNKRTSLGDTAFHEACFEGHADVVKQLREAGADPDIGNDHEVTSLMLASYADNAKVIKYVVDSKVELNRLDKDGRNVLFYAVAEGRLDTLAYLIDCGAEVRADDNGITLLMEAVFQGKTVVANYLLDNSTILNIDPEALDNAGRNVLFYASHFDNVSLFESLLIWGVGLVPANDGRTLMMAAALKSNKVLVKYLIDNCYKLGLDINEKDMKGRNVLFYAITGGSVDLLHHLIVSNVPIESSDDGVSILMQSVAKHREDITDYLLNHLKEYKLDLNDRDIDGWNAVMYATASAHVPLFVRLTDSGGLCESASDGRTNLMQAAAKGDVLMVEHILDNSQRLKLHLNQRDKDGWNALFYTIQGGHMDAFQLLLKRGVRPSSAHNGATLLMEAVDKNRADFVTFLLGHSHNGMAVDVAHKDDQGNNVLFYAAAAGNLGIIKDLLKAGCPVENDKFERNILMQAVLHGHTAVVQFLFNNSRALGIDAHQKDSDGRNLLFYCIEGGHVELMQALLNCGLKLSPDNRERTNLMQAARSGNVAITKYLLTNALVLGLDVNAVDQNKENALFYAARSGSLDVVTLLLQAGLVVQANHANVSVPSQCLSEGQFVVAKAFLTHACNLSEAINGKDTKGRTVLHHLILTADFDMFKEQSFYYNPECDSDANGCTLLMAACKHTPNLDFLRFLALKLKVDVDAVDSRNRNALFYAIESSHLQAVDFLLDLVTKAESDHSGLSPLHVATATGNHFIVETLLKSKFGKSLVKRTDKHGRNEVHYASMHGYTSLIELLYNHDSDINVQDDQGLTPTTYACAHGRYACLAALLRKGADPDALDKMSRNAVHHCFLGTNPSLRCCKLLVRHGTNVDCRDKEGVSPLMLACRTCAETHIPIIRFLITSGADPILQDNQGMDSFDHCPFHSEYVKALLKETTEMSASEKEALSVFRDQLVERIEVQGCLRGLLKEKIFTKTVNFEVMKRPAPERVDRLLHLLTLRGKNAFRGLCAVLRECGEPELAFMLLKHSYRKSEEIYW